MVAEHGGGARRLILLLLRKGDAGKQGGNKEPYLPAKRMAKRMAKRSVYAAKKQLKSRVLWI